MASDHCLVVASGGRLLRSLAAKQYGDADGRECNGPGRADQRELQAVGERGLGVVGHRPGRPETRAQVLEVARRRFLAEGYQSVTMRSVAAEADVDVALVSYFFGSKKGLFGAALALPANPPELLLGALPGDPATLPERVLTALLHTWDAPGHGGPLRVMVTAAVQDQELARLLKEVFEREMVARVAEHIGGTDAHYRAGAFIAQLAGLVFTRYVLRVDPIASMTIDDLTRHLAPGLRAALHGPRPGPRPRAPARTK